VRQGSVLLIICVTLVVGAAIFGIVGELREERSCRKACRPQAERILEDGCYCATAGGWVRAHEAEESH